MPWTAQRTMPFFEQSDSSDDNDEELANIAEGLTPVDISDESDEEFNGFYDE